MFAILDEISEKSQGDYIIGERGSIVVYILFLSSKRIAQ